MLACLPFLVSLYLRIRASGFDLPRIVVVIHLCVLVGTMISRRAPSRITPNPLFWLLAFVATYAAPVYTGLFLSYLGIVLHSYSSASVALLSLAILWLVIKSFVEEGFLRTDPQYAAYLQRVRWRWVPGIV
jgi:protein-S-isoprenylcysteine O-methyltransferase Ste14